MVCPPKRLLIPKVWKVLFAARFVPLRWKCRLLAPHALPIKNSQNILRYESRLKAAHLNWCNRPWVKSYLFECWCNDGRYTDFCSSMARQVWCTYASILLFTGKRGKASFLEPDLLWYIRRLQLFLRAWLFTLWALMPMFGRNRCAQKNARLSSLCVVKMALVEAGLYCL